MGVYIYSQLSSASAALLTLHSYPLVTGACSFVSHLDSPGSIQPGTHSFWPTGLITHTNLSSVLPGTHFYSRVERAHGYVWIKALPKSTTSTTNSAQSAIKPAISSLQVAQAGICLLSLIGPHKTKLDQITTGASPVDIAISAKSVTSPPRASGPNQYTLRALKTSLRNWYTIIRG